MERRAGCGRYANLVEPLRVVSGVAVSALANMTNALASVFFKTRRADMSDIAVWTNENRGSPGRSEFRGVRTPQMIEEPAPIGKPQIGHAVPGMETPERNSRGQGLDR